MNYALNTPAGWSELPYGKQVVIGDVAASYATMLAWSHQYRTARGIKPIEEMVAPADKIVIASSIEDQDGKPVRVLTFDDSTEPVFNSSSPYLYAAAQLTITNGEIFGIGINSRFAGAFPLDVGQYYVMFYEPLEDTEYMAMPTAIGPCTAYVLPSDKYTDGFMITVKNSAGELVDVEAVNISIVKA